MNGTWKIKKLGDVCEIFNGNSINAQEKKEKYTDLDDGYPFIATKDVGFDYTVDYENGVKIPFGKSGFKIAKANSVFICAEGGSAGRKVAFVEQDVCFGNKLFAIYPNNFDKLNSKYVFYYVQSNKFVSDFKKLLTGIIGGVSQKKFASITIPVPPLAEQKRLVALLDQKFKQIEALKQNATANLQNAKDLFQAELEKMLSHTQCKQVRNTVDFANAKSTKDKTGKSLDFPNPCGNNWKLVKLGEVCSITELTP